VTPRNSHIRANSCAVTASKRQAVELTLGNQFELGFYKFETGAQRAISESLTSQPVDYSVAISTRFNPIFHQTV